MSQVLTLNHRTIYFFSTGDIAEQLEQGINHAIDSYIGTHTNEQAHILRENLLAHPLPLRHETYQNPYWGMAFMLQKHHYTLDQAYGYSDFVSIVAHCVFPCLGLSNDASHIVLTCPATQQPLSYDNLYEFTAHLKDQLLTRNTPYSPHVAPVQRGIAR